MNWNKKEGNWCPDTKFSDKIDNVTGIQNLLGRGRRSTMVGVETGVFLIGLEDEVDVAFGTALPERICLFGEPSVFVVTGPTDWERPRYEEKCGAKQWWLDFCLIIKLLKGRKTLSEFCLVRSTDETSKHQFLIFTSNCGDKEIFLSIKLCGDVVQCLILQTLNWLYRSIK